jgi:transposase
MKSKPQIFKPYHQNQLMALPPTFDELISPSHPVRVVSQIIDQIDIDSILKKYHSVGRSSYHPRMLLKVLVYGYLCNIFSSRKLEAAVAENIYFMWLSGMQRPDHNTINRFRCEKLRDTIKDVFTQVVLLMVGSGHVDLRSVYTDGTKIESSANRYTFVWGKSIKKSRERIESQLEELWNYTQSVAKEELLDTRPTTFEATDPQAVKDTIERIDKALQGKDACKKVRQKLNYAKKCWPDAVDRYNRDEEILQERNSYSKTDTDATFMRMKDDHMKNGQLKPAYNVQISTNNQIITNYSLHQNPTDTLTLEPHLESFKQAYGKMPEEVTADAGYGSEQNYEYLLKNEIDAYVKYPYFDKEQNQKKAEKKNFIASDLHYNSAENCYFCPMGQRMDFVGLKKEKSDAGYEKTSSLYKAQNCVNCPVRGVCHQGKDERIIAVNHRLNELKNQAKALLISDRGVRHRKKRPVDVEPVFGNIKQNKGFKRFLLRGLDNVNVEFGLVSIAHNFAKYANLLILEDFLHFFERIFWLFSFKKQASITFTVQLLHKK